MNKKSFVVFLILTIVLMNIVIAQIELPDPTESETFKQAEEGKEKIEEFSEEEDKEAYLSREWTNFLRETGYLNTIYKANPVFKFLFGQEFSLSWAFVTAIVIWIAVVMVYFNFTSLMFKETITSLAIAILVGAITSNLLTPKIIEKVSPTVKTIWHNILFLFILIILAVVINVIFKSLKKVIEKRIEKNRLTQLEKQVKGTYKDIVEGASAMRKGSKK